MIIAITVSETYGKEWKEITQEQWDALREVAPMVPSFDKRDSMSYTPVIVDDAALRGLAKLNLNVKLAAVETNAHTMLVKMQDRIEELVEVVDKLPELYASAVIVQMHVPDQTLLTYDEVTYLEDACTDNLQSFLNEGWRILAVCPPNAKRRPDYILGRRSK